MMLQRTPSIVLVAHRFHANAGSPRNLSNRKHIHLRHSFKQEKYTLCSMMQSQEQGEN